MESDFGAETLHRVVEHPGSGVDARGDRSPIVQCRAQCTRATPRVEDAEGGPPRLAGRARYTLRQCYFFLLVFCCFFTSVIDAAPLAYVD